MNSLDYKVIEMDDQWEVWTPDQTGGCIGSGESHLAALCDAHIHLSATAEALLKDIHQKTA